MARVKRGVTARARHKRTLHGKGSVSVVDFATRRIVANWPIPDGGSPDMVAEALAALGRDCDARIRS